MQTFIGFLVSLVSLTAIIAFYFFYFKPNQDAKNNIKRAKSSEDAAKNAIMEAFKSDYDYLQN